MAKHLLLLRFACRLELELENLENRYNEYCISAGRMQLILQRRNRDFRHSVILL